MKIIHFSLFEYGFEIRGRVAKGSKYSFWGTTGFEFDFKPYGFYNHPHCIIRVHKLRLSFHLLIGFGY